MADPNSTAEKLSVQTPQADGLSADKRDGLRNDEREAPVAPKMSGGVKPDPNPLSSPADLRDAGEPEEPLHVEDPRSGP